MTVYFALLLAYCLFVTVGRFVLARRRSAARLVPAEEFAIARAATILRRTTR
jgi:hypothetical protein